MSSPKVVIPCDCGHPGCIRIEAPPHIKITVLEQLVAHLDDKRFRPWMAIYPALIGLLAGILVGLEIAERMGVGGQS